jgi:hypothetical protein
MNYKDFNAIVNTGNADIGNKGYITYHKQSSIERFKAFLDRKYPDWIFATLFDRKTNEKELIKRDKITLSSFQKMEFSK